MGQTLRGTVYTLVRWADEHVPEIDAARAAYDRRSALLAASLDGNGHAEPESQAARSEPPLEPLKR